MLPLRLTGSYVNAWLYPSGHSAMADEILAMRISLLKRLFPDARSHALCFSFSAAESDSDKAGYLL